MPVSPVVRGPFIGWVPLSLAAGVLRSCCEYFSRAGTKRQSSPTSAVTGAPPSVMVERVHLDFNRERPGYGLRPQEAMFPWKMRRPCLLFLVLMCQILPGCITLGFIEYLVIHGKGQPCLPPYVLACLHSLISAGSCCPHPPGALAFKLVASEFGARVSPSAVHIWSYLLELDTL